MISINTNKENKLTQNKFHGNNKTLWTRDKYSIYSALLADKNLANLSSRKTLSCNIKLQHNTERSTWGPLVISPLNVALTIRSALDLNPCAEWTCRTRAMAERLPVASHRKTAPRSEARLPTERMESGGRSPCHPGCAGKTRTPVERATFNKSYLAAKLLATRW